MEMKLLDAYDIPWKGLSNGCHDFDFEMTTVFSASSETRAFRAAE